MATEGGGGAERKTLKSQAEDVPLIHAEADFTAELKKFVGNTNTL